MLIIRFLMALLFGFIWLGCVLIMAPPWILYQLIASLRTSVDTAGIPGWLSHFP